ncbi:MAG: DUF695 domain-containing protein [Bacteroidia bacterium]
MEFLSKLFGQTEKKADYQPYWTFYFSNVNDKLSSIATDLYLINIAPVHGQESVVYVSIKMLNPKENELLLDDPQFQFEARGNVVAKGKGEIRVFLTETSVGTGRTP